MEKREQNFHTTITSLRCQYRALKTLIDYFLLTFIFPSRLLTFFSNDDVVGGIMKTNCQIIILQKNLGGGREVTPFPHSRLIALNAYQSLFLL
jgi:hypothetical protein